MVGAKSLPIDLSVEECCGYKILKTLLTPYHLFLWLKVLVCVHGEENLKAALQFSETSGGMGFLCSRHPTRSALPHAAQRTLRAFLEQGLH